MYLQQKQKVYDHEANLYISINRMDYILELLMDKNYNKMKGKQNF